jgi:hypothetical protein
MLAPNPYDLRNVVQEPAENTGGIEAMWYTLAANLVNFPATGDLAITQNLALQPDTFWYQLLSVRQTVRYKQARKDLGRHGDAFVQTLTGTVARHSGELAAGLEALDGQELVALYRDHNGQVQLLGTPEQPLAYTDTYDSGLVTGTRNNYDWGLAGQTPRRARPYFGTWQVSAGGLGGSIVLNAGLGGSIDIRDVAGNLMATVDAGHTVVVRSAFHVAFSIL